MKDNLQPSVKSAGGGTNHRQAILILAHKEFDEVLELSRLLNRSFNVYIHFDIKMLLTNEQKEVLQRDNIDYVQMVSADWGSFGISEATIELMRIALQNKDNRYFHIISGQDWPAIDVEDIYNFYINSDRIYMRFQKADSVVKSHEPVILWQKFYFDYHKINRRTLFGKIYHRVSIAMQKLFKVDKFKKLGFNLAVYCGANWMGLPRYALEYLLNYYDNNESVRKVFQTGFCSDEFWVQTILCNSDYADKIVNCNYRFVKWTKKYDNYPAILDETDFEDIIKGEYHFIRKVDYIHSAKLKEKLKIE